jgi:hypothetical protein
MLHIQRMGFWMPFFPAPSQIETLAPQRGSFDYRFRRSNMFYYTKNNTSSKVKYDLRPKTIHFTCYRERSLRNGAVDIKSEGIEQLHSRRATDWLGQLVARGIWTIMFGSASDSMGSVDRSSCQSAIWAWFSRSAHFVGQPVRNRTRIIAQRSIPSDDLDPIARSDHVAFGPAIDPNFSHFLAFAVVRTLGLRKISIRSDQAKWWEKSSDCAKHILIEQCSVSWEWWLESWLC